MSRLTRVPHWLTAVLGRPSDNPEMSESAVKTGISWGQRRGVNYRFANDCRRAVPDCRRVWLRRGL